MKSLKISVVGFACTLALVVMRGAVSAPASTNGPTRNFVFTYLTKIPARSPDDKVSRMWIPLPQSDRYQTIRNLKIDAPFAYAERRDPEYGNEYLYVQVPPSKLKEPSEVRVSFEATRREHRVSLDARSVGLEETLKIGRDRTRFGGDRARIERDTMRATRGFKRYADFGGLLELRRRNRDIERI